MAFFDRFRRNKAVPATDPALEPRNNRHSLAETRVDLQKRVLRDLRAQQLGAEAIFPDESMLVRYDDGGDEAIRVSLGIPPARFYIKSGENGVEVAKVPVQKPIFTPENRPEALVLSEKFFDRGVQQAEDAQDQQDDHLLDGDHRDV